MKYFMNNEKWLKTRNYCLEIEGINNPEKLDDFVEQLYTLLKEKYLTQNMVQEAANLS